MLPALTSSLVPGSTVLPRATIFVFLSPCFASAHFLIGTKFSILSYCLELRLLSSYRLVVIHYRASIVQTTMSPFLSYSLCFRFQRKPAFFLFQCYHYLTKQDLFPKPANLTVSGASFCSFFTTICRNTCGLDKYLLPARNSVRY